VTRKVPNLKETTMRRAIRWVTVSGVLASTVSLARPSLAAHHLWRFSQAFSDAAGDVQFVQLKCMADNNENSLGTFTITSNGKTFNFMTDLPNTNTSNAWMLIATSGFGSLHGAVAPDYVLPSKQFFSTSADTLNYASGTDTWSLGSVPTDGVHALMRDINTLAVTTAPNAPINFAGAMGTGVNLSSSSVPALPRAGIALLVGAMLLAGSGLLRRQGPVRG
jgi:hypothetical protein